MTSFEGKVALITGGGSGIGRATTHAFARKGASVAIVDIDREKAEETARQIERYGAEALVVEADVADADAVASMAEEVMDGFGRLDCACNSAGLESTKVPIADYTEEDFDRMININLRGVWLCMKYEIRRMLEGRGGAIVNVASALGKVGFEKKSAYVAAKHGVLGLTKAGALEYAQDDIRINAVCPSFIDTPMQIRTGTLIHPEQLDEVVQRHPVGRFGTPEEVAEAILWLASDEASFVTGQALSVDGGYTAQ